MAHPPRFTPPQRTKVGAPLRSPRRGLAQSSAAPSATSLSTIAIFFPVNTINNKKNARVIIMFSKYEDESVKARLDMYIGSYILAELFGVYEFDLLDAHSVIFGFVPPTYIPSREAYFFF